MSAVNYNATTVPGALWNTLTGQTTTQDALTNSANSIAARVEIEIALSLGVTLHWPSKPHTNKTPGHWETIKDKVRELVDSGDYDEIWVNKGLGQVKPGIKPNRRPDIFGRRKKDGKIDQFEVPSKTDDPKDLLERMRDSAKKLRPDAGDCELVPLNSP